MLGDADAVRAGCVDDQDPAGARRGDVDVVDAGAGTRNDAQPRRGREEIGGDSGGAADEQGIGVREVTSEGRGGAARPGINFPAGFGAEEIQRGSRQVVGDEDFQLSDSSRGTACGRS